jgi:hypothetical protein
MDAAALERYAFFKRIGMFGVEQNSRRGAVQFLRIVRAILSDADHILWLTPQGRFADARERPVQFKPGIGHLGDAAERVCFLPLAVEYVFWEERLPEILVRFGPPFETQPDDTARNAAAWLGFSGESSGAHAGPARGGSAATRSRLLSHGAEGTQRRGWNL